MDRRFDAWRDPDAQMFRNIYPRIRLRRRQHDHHGLARRGPLADFEQATVDDPVDRRADLVALGVDSELIAPCRCLFDGLFGLCQFLHGGSRQELLQLGTVEFQARLGCVQRRFRAVQQFRGGQFLRMDLLYPGVVGLTELEFVGGASDIRTGGGNELAARATNQFIEPRLRLSQCRLGFGDTGPGTCGVLAHQ